MTVLAVEELTVAFGGLTAVNGLSFAIEDGAITGLIGPNGSGKTTAFNLISGVLEPDRGRVLLHGDNVAGWAPHRIAARGLVRTFQVTRIFGQMTVWENMLVVARHAGAEQRAVDLLARVGLSAKRDDLGAELSYGQAKLLELARAVMLEPRVLLLDEPFAGVNPTMAQGLLALIRELNADGVTLLVIDHAMSLMTALCERMLVMDLGELIADGSPAQIQADPRVVDAYLGRRSNTLTPAAPETVS